VDLLHIDGFHTFRAARADFRLFRDRLSPGAPVLFHDVYNRDFPGLLALWPWLALRYRTFRFQHASGLGILLAPGGDRTLGLPRRRTLTETYAAIRHRLDEPVAETIAALGSATHP
jgi:hypothetical protein